MLTLLNLPVWKINGKMKTRAFWSKYQAAAASSSSPLHTIATNTCTLPPPTLHSSSGRVRNQLHIGNTWEHFDPEIFSLLLPVETVTHLHAPERAAAVCNIKKLLLELLWSCSLRAHVRSVQPLNATVPSFLSQLTTLAWFYTQNC